MALRASCCSCVTKICKTYFLYFTIVQLILKPRDELLESLSGKNDSEEKEVDKPSEQEASKSLSEVSSSEEEESSEPGLLSYIL